MLQSAQKLGFDLCGICAAKSPETFEAYRRWINAGMFAGMSYLAERLSARNHPDSILPGVRSLLLLGVSYTMVLNSEDHPVKQVTGIAEYARGIDYHHWIRKRLKLLAIQHQQRYPHGKCRGVVDTAPILEKQFAADAGLGRFGKNTLLIHPRFGSKFFLAALLSTEELTPITHPILMDDPCRDCNRCLEACPTGALTEPYVLDARRCLNYWTIEQHGKIPQEIADKLGNRFFGCDTCQAVCPANRDCPATSSGTVDPRTIPPDLLRQITAGSPVNRGLKIKSPVMRF
jgi:epoxyqueuosine reductase